MKAQVFKIFTSIKTKCIIGFYKSFVNTVCIQKRKPHSANLIKQEYFTDILKAEPAIDDALYGDRGGSPCASVLM